MSFFDNALLPGTLVRLILRKASSSIGPSYESAMPMAKTGMLFMKKLAKCSAATTISASGRVARMSSPILNSALCSAWRVWVSARSARAVMPGAWLQAPQ